MKYLLLILIGLTAPLFAQAAEENFDAQKAAIATNVDKRIASLQQMKTCVASKTDPAGLKACRETHRLEMDAIGDANIDAKIQRLQEAKAKKRGEH